MILIHQLICCRSVASDVQRLCNVCEWVCVCVCSPYLLISNHTCSVCALC